jgi:hypothetical protein
MGLVISPQSVADRIAETLLFNGLWLASCWSAASFLSSSSHRRGTQPALVEDFVKRHAITPA